MIDALLSAIAPHSCFGCGRLGAVLCGVCIDLAGEPPEPRCAGCKTLSAEYKTCRTCRSWLNITSVFVSTQYQGPYAQLLKAYKFDLKRQAAYSMAAIMAQLRLPVEQRVLLCPLPTASSRIRQRGFDHITLLARAYLHQADTQQIMLRPVLRRSTNTRQVGASRRQRTEQMQHEFYVSKKNDVQGKTFLLFDDVTTTGASLAAAAQTLKDAGAKRVYALVFAQKV